jgi:hypothetical protein
METAASVSAADARDRVGAVPRAGAIGLAATGIGLLVQLLFFDAGLGINYPIAITALLAAAWFVPQRPTRWPGVADLWLPTAAAVLAAFVALRGDPTLLKLDILGSITLAALAIASFGGMAVVQRPFLRIFVLGLRVVVSAVGAGIVVLEGIRQQLPAARVRSGLEPASAVVRGLLLALPLLLLFIVLFSSADAVFGQLLQDLPDLDLGQLPGRITVALLAAWLTAGLLAFVSAGREQDQLTGSRPQKRWLGSTEAITVLVALDLLFAAFVVVQATYLFGGRDTLEAGGLTYSEYARRGFFELLAVAMVVGALVLGFEAFVARRSRAYLIGIVALVCLTLVVLASAFLRLRLYQDAYGWTELRFYVLAAILWLAIGAAGAVACIVLDRTRWLPHGLVMLSAFFGLVFNVIGPVRLIAERNVGRLSDPNLPADAHRRLDVAYLAYLGDDALAVVAEHFPEGLPASARETAQWILADRAATLAGDPAIDEWQAWNLSRERIRALLSQEGLLR